MDFFGILFDMKNGKKVPYSKTYFDTLLAENLSGVTTLTGTLPLTFTTSETALRSWTIYGNNTPHNYSAEGTLPLTFSTHTAGNASDWEIMGNDESYNLFDGSFKEGYYSTTTGKFISGGGRYIATEKIAIESTQTYTISFDCDKEGTSSGNRVDSFVYFWNGDTYLGYEQATTKEVQTFTAPANTTLCAFIVGVGNSGTMDIGDVTEAMLVRGSTPPSTYIPYQQGVGQRTENLFGYEIPISVNGTPQTFYIGSTPLRAGQSISKTSTGVDIELFEGSNTITTSLYNKPEMSITGLDYVGVGEPINDGWQIPLTVSDGTNTQTVNVPIDTPLTEGESITDTLTISTYTGENTIDTTMTNKPQMTITYKGG